MLRRLPSLTGAALVVLAALLALSAPAGAQQLVDAGKEGDGSGGLAFVIMVVVICCITGSLFFLDHVRRNRLPKEED